MSAQRRRTPRALWETLVRPSWADLGTWLLALVLASGLWFFVNAGARTSERTLRVRLDLVNVPNGMVILGEVPDYVEVRVSGTGLMLSSIDQDTLRTSLDLSGVVPGVATYTLNAKDFALPRSVEVNRVTPSRVSIQVQALRRKRLPIEIDYRGDLQPGLRIGEVQLLPRQVRVRGPRDVVDGLERVPTEPLERGSLDPGVNERTLELLSPAPLVQVRRPTVVAQIVVKRVLAERRFDGVSLAIQSGEGWTVRPSEVTVVVKGPAAELSAFELAPGAAYVDAADLPPGARVEVRPLVTLPPGYEVVRIEPELVALEPKPEPTDRELVGPPLPPPFEENP